MTTNILAENIRAINTNNDFDCLLMFSGGKDSTYLLHYLSEILRLRVATVSLMHDFLPIETRDNINRFSRTYSKKHIPIDNSSLSHSGKHFLESWINNPDEGSLITLCTGCRLGLIKPVIETARKEKINVVITGETPFESSNYKLSSVNFPRGKEGKFYFYMGYLRLLWRNPKLISNPRALLTQIEEFYYFKNKKQMYLSNGLSLLKPFFGDVPYHESTIIDKLDELGWKKPNSTTNNSYWRSDCDMYAIRHYFYNQIAGYNEHKNYYKKLLEDNQITEDQFEKKTSAHFAKEEVMELLVKLELSSPAIEKYRLFLKNLPSTTVPYPECGSCKGLSR